MPLGGGLEVVLHRKLHLTRTGPNWGRLALDIAEGGRSDIAVRVAEVCAVEEVIGISPEVDLLLTPDGEVLQDRRTVRLETRRPFR